MLSHVVNISSALCKYYHYGNSLDDWNEEGCTSYLLLYVGYWLKKTGYDSQLYF